MPIWRDIANAERRSENQDPDKLDLHPPEGRFTLDPELLTEAYHIMKMTGTMPHPYEVMAMPRRWVNELLRFSRGVKYAKDYEKRPWYLK